MYYNNLLKETLEDLKSQGKTPTDVLWVGTLSTKTSWDNFAKLADFCYDDGFGIQEINENLLVVGKDWWMERHEYDGSEWWEFKSMPIMPSRDDFTHKDIIIKKKYH